jgi:hypothetical protein
MREFIDLNMSRRVTHPDGFVVVPGRVARSGVQEYRAFELDLDGDPLRVVRVLRHPDDVFAADSLATYTGAVFTHEHIGKVTPANFREKGAGTIGRPRRDGIYVAADITITTQDALDALATGKKQLSATYDADLVWTAGNFEGVSYEAQQKNIRVNGVALVGAARCGPACRIDDENPGVTTMRKVMIDGIPFDLEDTAAAAVEKLSGTLTTTRGELETLRGQLGAAVKFGDAQLPVSNPGAIQAVLDEQIRKLADQARDVMTPAQRDAMVADWVKTMDNAKRLAPKITTADKTCAAIRREVVAGLYDSKKGLVDAVLAGKSIADASDDSIRTAFAVLATSVPAEGSGTRRDSVVDAMNTGQRQQQQQDDNAREDGRREQKHHVGEDGLPDPEAARASWLKQLTAR